MQRSIWMKYSSFLVVSILLMQGFQIYADEPAKPATPNTKIMIGTPLSNKLQGNTQVTFEFNSNFTDKAPRYSVYIPGYSKTNFDFTVVYNASETVTETIDLSKERTDYKDSQHYIYQFEGKKGTYLFTLKNIVADKELPYTIVISISTPITSGQKISETLTLLIKSYDLTVENPSTLLLEASPCVGEVAIVFTSPDPSHFYDEFNTGYIVGTFEMKQSGSVWIDVLQKTPVVNGTAENAEFKLNAELKAVDYKKPELQSLKLVNFSNVTQVVEFEPATSPLGSNSSEFKIQYTLVAATTKKDLNKTIRCGPRENGQTINIRNITLDNCTNATCNVSVGKFKLPTNVVYLGLQGEILNLKNNQSERVLYDGILEVHQVPETDPTGAGSSKTWIYILVAAIAVLAIVGVLLWRRNQHRNLKEEEIAGGAYQPLNA